MTHCALAFIEPSSPLILINQLFTGKIRLKLLSRILLNPETQVYLRQLEKEFNVSSNTVRIELNKLTEMKLIEEVFGEKIKVKKYKANLLHPLYHSLRNIIYQYLGIDHLIEDIFNKLGSLQEVYITGDIAEGKNSLFIDLIVVGEIDKLYYNRLVEKAELILNKKIRTGFYLPSTFSTQILREVTCVCIFTSDNNSLNNLIDD
ncbi:hypothetical protein [Sediminibacterium sp. C3]|uniref:hypothetical protein n=1 Tax=Sediminibacterium sp. C3 TaxID=1267211 RepID=UPI000429C3F6|nr:hypothetical protein [Sediminibacterium sp. C3]